MAAATAETSCSQLINRSLVLAPGEGASVLGVEFVFKAPIEDAVEDAVQLAILSA